MKKQQELLKLREGLISQIRGLKDFENFLTPHSFHALRPAASHGVVIIILHCKWRSDIIILLHDSPPSLITTSYKLFSHANRLKERLLSSRKNHGPNSKRYADALCSVLADLYNLVGEPVIKRLNELKVGEQSRIWWCPTSVFRHFPLHAMGPIPSSDKSAPRRYFSDLYISSYTPTLSALIASRNPYVPVPAVPILLDAQPTPSLPARANSQVIRGLDLQVTHLSPDNATPTIVLDELQRCQFADIGYHGVLKEGKPFDAALRFRTRDDLTLLDLVRLRLPTCEFAFLPGSHTADLAEESIPDEVLHFAAAVQYSGCRSVIGSMWETVDEDGRDLARDVYSSMFSRSESGHHDGIPYYEKSAAALRDGVQKMRRRVEKIRSSKVPPLVRWVNFVHIGA
jgi:CHAT domain-containing protein